MIKAGIVGASGYTGWELVKLLSKHPDVRIEFTTARSDAGKAISTVFPTRLDLTFERLESVHLGAVDVLFLAVPHGAAAPVAAAALRAGVRVIDLSADFRLTEAGVYAQTYGHDHPAPQLLAGAVYGLTEWVRPALREARLVANPGCYPTSILLALAPLLRAGLLAGATVIADSKSGVSGAGRVARVGSLFAEVSDNLKPYSLGTTHRHVTEIEQELAAFGGKQAPKGLIFAPHLLPVTRGILSTMYVPLPEDVSEAALRRLYKDCYEGEPFVWVLPDGDTATLAHTVHTNRCAISLHPVRERGQLIVVSTIDNLLKGAAGQAVQTMNVMMGVGEGRGLG